MRIPRRVGLMVTSPEAELTKGPAMRAVVFSDHQTFPAIEEVEEPRPGPGEVLLRVAGAGACHSDVAIYREFTADMPGAQKPPFTLGHENSGWI